MTKKYCASCEMDYTPAEDWEWTCPTCGDDLVLVAEENPREKYDDDGREYADPRDFRDGLE